MTLKQLTQKVNKLDSKIADAIEKIQAQLEQLDSLSASVLDAVDEFVAGQEQREADAQEWP